MRLPIRKRQEPHPDPSRPHEFRQIHDPGIMAIAGGAGMSRSFGAATPVAVTDNFIRKSRCGVPGCGRERHDPIHEADRDSQL
ncbi:MAG: hypothetical protein A2V84_08925 [Chloroflexi bacterium RBG_16_70_13]|nr:MAG: hypothetical protein A2V84_08925 [Chloroflexi bacterium RBG_16_70_13]